MDPALLRMLLAVDDPERTESAAEFDWSAEIERARLLVPVIGEIAGRKFELDEHVQDASFFTDIATYDEWRTSAGGLVRGAFLAVRFSSFGRLFTVWSMQDDPGKNATFEHAKVSSEVRRKVVDAVIERGYVYVEAESLNQPYSGANPHLKGATWWIRFFDYL